MVKTTKQKSKYSQLCDSYSKGVEDCNNYCTECRDFVRDMKNTIVEYLECRETKLYMFQPTAGFSYKDPAMHGDSFDTEFGENGQAAIGFALNLNGEDLEEKFISFVLFFKKEGEQFVFNFDGEKHFSNTPEGINDFCEYLFKAISKDLENRLDNFLESPENVTKPIGFHPDKK